MLSDMTEDFTSLHFPFFKNAKCEKQSEIGAVGILHCRVSELGFRCRICSQSWLGELQVGAAGAWGCGRQWHGAHWHQEDSGCTWPSSLPRQPYSPDGEHQKELCFLPKSHGTCSA